jgi:protein TonB
MQRHNRILLQKGTISTGAGDVSPPVLVHAVTPQFPKEGRGNSVKVNVLVNLYVDVDGKSSDVHVVRATYLDHHGHVIAEPVSSGVAKAMEESATHAVMQYRCRPAKKNGVPVRVELNVQVPFEIF